jgi:hypothetical protein
MNRSELLILSALIHELHGLVASIEEELEDALQAA